MMHSSSGCGEKTSAFGAVSGSGGREGVGKPPSGYCLALAHEARDFGDEMPVWVHGASDAERGKAGGGDGLTVTLVLLVRHVDLDALGQLAETLHRARHGRRRR